jgi:hypothetical protein
VHQYSTDLTGTDARIASAQLSVSALTPTLLYISAKILKPHPPTRRWHPMMPCIKLLVGHALHRAVLPPCLFLNPKSQYPGPQSRTSSQGPSRKSQVAETPALRLLKFRVPISADPCVMTAAPAVFAPWALATYRIGCGMPAYSWLET